MFYECAISPEALFEIAIDRRNYRDFIKGFSTGGNFLYSELPKLKRNKKQLLGLLNANHSELQKKRLEDLIIFLKNNNSVKCGSRMVIINIIVTVIFINSILYAFNSITMMTGIGFCSTF